MNRFRETPQFIRWFDALDDEIARARIRSRLRQASLGGFGDCEPVGEGVSEMRIDYGPGYRIYYAREGKTVYVLLAGSDKDSQRRAIKTAKALWKALKGNRHGSNG